MIGSFARVVMHLSSRVLTNVRQAQVAFQWEVFARSGGWLPDQLSDPDGPGDREQVPPSARTSGPAVAS